MFRWGQIILRTDYRSTKTVSFRSLLRPQHSPETPQATTAVSRAGAERARLIRSRISMTSLMVALCTFLSPGSRLWAQVTVRGNVGVTRVFYAAF